jgi:hypothetical protein
MACLRDGGFHGIPPAMAVVADALWVDITTLYKRALRIPNVSQCACAEPL